ncbi:MAG: DUF5317 domain-containing protein [Clostridia bacterium]|nr:DUF5317 domain-containing protein [Clostridia bacterium]
MIFLLAVPLGVVAGLARGGRVARIGEMRLRLAWLVLVTFLARAFLREAGRAGLLEVAPIAPALHAGSYAALLVVVLANLRLAWVGLAGVGVLANLAVVAANGGRMPVRLSPSGAPGPEWALGSPGDYMHAAMTDATRLPWLGDWIYVHLPPLPAESYSPGDLVLAAGVFLVLQAAVRGRAAGGPLG